MQISFLDRDKNLFHPRGSFIMRFLAFSVLFFIASVMAIISEIRHEVTGATAGGGAWSLLKTLSKVS